MWWNTNASCILNKNEFIFFFLLLLPQTFEVFFIELYEGMGVLKFSNLFAHDLILPQKGKTKKKKLMETETKTILEMCSLFCERAGKSNFPTWNFFYPHRTCKAKCSL